jgi:L-asparaginase
MTIVLNLGGTINSAYRNGIPVDVGVREIINPDINIIDIMPVSSNSLQWKHLVTLRNSLLDNKVRAGGQFIVTTGTDSLEEVAYFLSLIKPVDVSVAIVGALRLRSDTDSDGERWLSCALEWLDNISKPGIAVCCGGPCIEGFFVEKVYTDDWSFRPLGDSTGSDGKWLLSEELDLDANSPRVPLLSVGIDVGPWIAEILELQNYDGLVIEAFAAGDVPDTLSAPLKRVLLRNIPVVLSSKSRPGQIEPLFPGVPGCSYDLLEAGALSAGSMDGTRARISLMVALASRPAIDTRTIFRSYVDALAIRRS